MSEHNEANTRSGGKPHVASFSDGVSPHARRQPDTKPRRPKTLLLFTLVVTAILISAIIVILNSKPGDDPSSAPLPVDQTTSDAGKEAGSADSGISGLAQRVEALGTQLALHSDDANTRIAQHAETIRALEEKIEAVTKTERIAALEDSLKQARDALGNDIARVEQSLKRLRAASRPKAVKTSKPTLPFRIVSIDLWDGVPYVGLFHDGRIELVRFGQARGGWTVDRIDHRSGTVSFRNESNQTIERLQRP